MIDAKNPDHEPKPETQQGKAKCSCSCTCLCGCSSGDNASQSPGTYPGAQAGDYTGKYNIQPG